VDSRAASEPKALTPVRRTTSVQNQLIIYWPMLTVYVVNLATSPVTYYQEVPPMPAATSEHYHFTLTMSQIGAVVGRGLVRGA
jgi:hypothetical protein